MSTRIPTISSSPSTALRSPTFAQVDAARQAAGIRLEPSLDADSEWCVGDAELLCFARALRELRTSGQQVEAARITAGIKLEPSFDADSKWCVGDPELQRFAQALLEQDLTSGQAAGHCARQAQDIRVLLDVLSRIRQWDALDIPGTDGAFWQREIDSALVSLSSGTQARKVKTTPIAPRTAPAALPALPDAVIESLARTGCGGDDIRWTFSDAGLRRTLAAHARLLGQLHEVTTAPGYRAAVPA